MTSRSIVSPHDQRVTFVELFFDLVFVFAVTQVVHLLHPVLAPAAVGKALLVFWLVWWAWTQFTWALNAADTTHPRIVLTTLVATVLAFFMAIALPGAFAARAMWFAASYVLVRLTGLAVYAWVAAGDRSQSVAVRVFGLVSLSGLAAVLAGAWFGGPWQYAGWGLAILLDVVAAVIGGRMQGWNLHPEHFAERHGLFVIIALGEGMIVAAGGIAAGAPTSALVMVSTLAIAIACAFWWTYFMGAKPALDRALERCADAARAMMARDTFSLLHFPMLCGVVALAAVLEEAVSHPAAALPLAWRGCLAASVFLFVGGMAVATWRAERRVLAGRVALSTLTAVAIVAIAGVPAALTLGLALLGVSAVAVIEHRGGAR